MQKKKEIAIMINILVLEDDAKLNQLQRKEDSVINHAINNTVNKPHIIYQATDDLHAFITICVA